MVEVKSGTLLEADQFNLDRLNLGVSPKSPELAKPDPANVLGRYMTWSDQGSALPSEPIANPEPRPTEEIDFAVAIARIDSIIEGIQGGEIRPGRVDPPLEYVNQDGDLCKIPEVNVRTIYYLRENKLALEASRDGIGFKPEDLKPGSQSNPLNLAELVETPEGRDFARSIFDARKEKQQGFWIVGDDEPRQPTASNINDSLRYIWNQANPGEELPEDLQVPRYLESYTGRATWYGPGFHGRRAADGSIFDQNAMTAASNIEPLGSVVRVTNLNTGRAVEVRITDTGGFAHPKVIDLSRGAASKIGGVRAGNFPVQIDVVSRPN